MSKEEMYNEIMYQISKEMIDRFLIKGLITKEEHRKIDELNLIKFLPKFAKVCG